ncbi:hypothetical protein GX586_10320 [bacterium]|nr:hypothetical protein [bacterium]
MASSFLVLIGYAAAWLLARRHARIGGVAARHIDWLALCAIAGLTCGSALYRWLVDMPPAKDTWTAWLAPVGNVYVALISACVPPAVYCLCRRLNLAVMADIAAPSLAIAIVFARMNCFLVGCCWGDICCDRDELAVVLDERTIGRVQTVPALSGAGWPLAVCFPRGSVVYTDQMMLGLFERPQDWSLPCHPVQLYEAACMGGLVIALMWCFPRRHTPLQIACVTSIVYGTVRFLLEFLRADHGATWHGLTMTQVISAAFIVTGIALLPAVRNVLARSSLTDSSSRAKKRPLARR